MYYINLSNFQFDWLVSHITLKHLPLAQPHKCFFENCIARFRTPAQLANHLKTNHRDSDEENPKAKKVEKIIEEEDIKTEKNTESAFYVFRGKRIPKNQIQDNFDRRIFDWFHEVQIEASRMNKPMLKLIPSRDISSVKGSRKRKIHVDHVLDLVDEPRDNSSKTLPSGLVNGCREKHFKEIVSGPMNGSQEASTKTFTPGPVNGSQEESSKLITSKLSPAEARIHLKKVFPDVRRPSCRPQDIVLDGIRYQLKRNKSKKLFKKIKTNEGKFINVFNASDHQKITDMTFDQEGKDMMNYWIKVDDKKFGKM